MLAAAVVGNEKIKYNKTGFLCEKKSERVRERERERDLYNSIVPQSVLSVRARFFYPPCTFSLLFDLHFFSFCARACVCVGEAMKSFYRAL